MLKWFLTDNNAYLFAGMISPITFIAFELYIRYFEKFNKSKAKVLCYFIVSLSPIIMLALLGMGMKAKYIPENDWKVVYQNEANANIKINLDWDTIEAGIDVSNYKKYTKELTHGKITAEKNGNQWSESIILQPENVIKNENGNQLIKIEYRKLKGRQYTLFGEVGELEPLNRGEIRLTIGTKPNQDEIQELKDIFK